MSQPDGVVVEASELLVLRGEELALAGEQRGVAEGVLERELDRDKFASGVAVLEEPGRRDGVGARRRARRGSRASSSARGHQAASVASRRAAPGAGVEQVDRFVDGRGARVEQAEGDLVQDLADGGARVRVGP